MLLSDPEKNWIPILLNRTAGPRQRLALVKRLLALLRGVGMHPQIFTERAEFVHAVLDPSRRESCRCAVAGGGDGTIHAIINALPRVPLAILPLGSENLLARALGIRLNALRLAAMIAARQQRVLDLGRVNDRLFTLMASSGFDADVVAQVHAHRRGHVSKWDYLRAIGHRLWFYRYPAISVQCDDEPTVESAAHVFVFNWPCYAFDLPFCAEASATDHALDVVLFRERGSLDMLRYLALLACGRHREQEDVLHRRVRKVVLNSQPGMPTPIQADGDPLGKLPARIEIVPRGLQVLVPPTLEQGDTHDWRDLGHYLEGPTSKTFVLSEALTSTR